MFEMAVESDRLPFDASDDYNGNPTTVAVRRLARERGVMSRDDSELRSQGIFHCWDDAAPHKAVALLLGPRGTPYANGFYLFEITFPNNYPLKPPRVIFLTGDSRVRFNPNLYVNGQVCLSVLGTWQGPSWTSLCTFRTTLVSIHSLLCPIPMQNEPGREDDAASSGYRGRDCDLYSAMLRYENVAVAVARQLSEPLPIKFAALTPAIAGLFLRHFDCYLLALQEFDACEGDCDRSPVFGFITRYQPSAVRSALEELRRQIVSGAFAGGVEPSDDVELGGSEGEHASTRETALGSADDVREAGPETAFVERTHSVILRPPHVALGRLRLRSLHFSLFPCCFVICIVGLVVWLLVLPLFLDQS